MAGLALGCIAVLMWMSYRFGRACQQVDDILAVEEATSARLNAERRLEETERFLAAVKP